MTDKLTIDFSNPLPVFPLPGCVLLPHTTIPLHIYENRYRRMVHDVLDSHGLITMALFEGNGWKNNYQDNPPMRPYVCVGYLIKHERLADGRYNLLLQGICRAKIVEEVVHEPYRKAILEPTELRLPMEIDLSEQRHRIENLLCEPLLKELASVSAIHNWLSTEIPTSALIDLAIMTVCSNVEQRYDMLVEQNAFCRAKWLEKLLEGTYQTLTTAERFREAQSPDGIFLN